MLTPWLLFTPRRAPERTTARHKLAFPFMYAKSSTGNKTTGRATSHRRGQDRTLAGHVLAKSPLTHKGLGALVTAPQRICSILQPRTRPRARGSRAAPAPETHSCPFRALATRALRRGHTLKGKYTIVSAAFLWHKTLGGGGQSSFHTMYLTLKTREVCTHGENNRLVR